MIIKMTFLILWTCYSFNPDKNGQSILELQINK